MSNVEWDGIPNCRSSISKGFMTDSHNMVTVLVASVCMYVVCNMKTCKSFHAESLFFVCGHIFRGRSSYIKVIGSRSR